MAGFVKLMSSENMPDSSPFKAFQLVSLPDGGKVEFKRNERGLDTCIIHKPEHDPEEYLMHGNVYVLSDAGKTIASRGTNVPCALEPSQELNDEDVAAAALITLEFGNITAAIGRAAEKNSQIVPALGEFLAGMVKAGNQDAIKVLRYANEYLKA
jgi:hypothetical protein